MAAKNAKPDAKAKKTPKAKPVTGFAPLKFKDYTITQKRSGRYEVVTSTTGKNVNGIEKEKLLIEAKLLKESLKKSATEETAAQ